MANNLRVVYDNAADRATIVASSTAGTLVASNLSTDYKSEVWRSTGLTATLTITWPTAELIGMVALAFASLSSAATFRVRGYQNDDDSTPLFDVDGFACYGADFDAFPWGTVPLGVNAYSYGGGAYGVLWTPVHACQKIVLDIADSNPLGYIEASRLVCGTYWEPIYSAESGATVGITDTSKNERTDAGDLRTDRGTIHKTLSFDLNVMPKEDRDALYNILRGNGMFKPVYISLVPVYDEDETGEQIFQIYGKVSKSANIKWAYAHMFSTKLEIEEV
jgi:hypothetical protein